jgi:hypothetical protein
MMPRIHLSAFRSYERDLARIVAADRLGYQSLDRQHLTERWENARLRAARAQALVKTEDHPGQA